jgi:hypothetical protein
LRDGVIDPLRVEWEAASKPYQIDCYVARAGCIAGSGLFLGVHLSSRFASSDDGLRPLDRGLFRWRRRRYFECIRREGEKLEVMTVRAVIVWRPFGERCYCEL